jgi:hypothetical protein
VLSSATEAAMTKDEFPSSDVKREIDRLTTAFFRAVSFEAGEQPRYDHLYELFIGNGLLIRNSGPAPEIANIAQFIEPRQQLLSSGELTHFKEIELAEITEMFGTIAHRFSTYAKSGILNGKPFHARGMISTQFIFTPDGWRISAMAWDDESPQREIPERYKAGLLGESG